MLCCIAQKAASRREKIPPGTKFLVKHDTILQQKEELRIDTARRVWDNGGNKQNAKGVVTMPPELRWLSDPTVFAVNRLDAHSDHVCYRSAAEAAAVPERCVAFRVEPLPRRPPGGFLAAGR